MNRPLFPHTCLGVCPAFLEISVVYTANNPEKLRGGRVIIVLNKVFANQYSCLEESKSLVTKSCSVEKVHFQVVKFV
jgi:hypothetical protein